MKKEYKLQPFAIDEIEIIPLKIVTNKDGSLKLNEWIKRTKYCDEYIKDGVYHRSGDLPAVVYKDGEKQWFVNGLQHRDGNKPAAICPDGEIHFYQNGKFHRENGPAIEDPITGYNEYWMHGQKLTEQEFLQRAQDVEKIQKDFNKVTELLTTN